jgi:D-erythrulose 1-phosphate 3-epimerase
VSELGGHNLDAGAIAPDLTLGINTCFAAKRWPEPGQWVAIVVDQLGLSDCQVTFDLFDPALDLATAHTYADAVRSESLAAGLRVHSTFTGLAAYSGNLLLHPDEGARRAAEAWLRRAIDVTATVGARGTGGFLGAMSVADSQDGARRELLLSSMTEALGRLSEHAARQGLEFLLFENMAVEREFGHSIEQALELESLAAQPGSDRTPWVLCLDLGHPCVLDAGGPSADPLEWIRTPWTNPPVYQIQQANRQGDHHWPFTPERNAAGLLHADAVARALRQQSTPKGSALFLEVIHPDEYPDQQVIADLRVSVAYWREALAGAGAERATDGEDTGVDR